MVLSHMYSFGFICIVRGGYYYPENKLKIKFCGHSVAFTTVKSPTVTVIEWILFCVRINNTNIQ